MSRYSQDLGKKLKELNGDYQPDCMSIGRLVTIIGNPYGLFNGLSDSNRTEIVDIIRGDKNKSRESSLSEESIRVAYYFTNTLLLQKYGMNLPLFSDHTKFKKINNYEEYFTDLATMNKSSISRCAKDNIDNFLKSPNGGYFKGRLDETVIMKSWEPHSSPIVRVSFRTKTRTSFVEKALERFVNFDESVIQKNYSIPGIDRDITGKEIFLEYFRRFQNSGSDLYDFFARENPQYLRGNDLDIFKSRLASIFPVDHDGVKIIVKSRKDAEFLAQDILGNKYSHFGGFPILHSISENDLGIGKKDGSITIGIGSMLSHSGMAEVKIVPVSAVMESEFGPKMHLKYKDIKKKQGEEKLAKKDAKNNYSNLRIRYYYDNLSKAFNTTPRLIK